MDKQEKLLLVAVIAAAAWLSFNAGRSYERGQL